MGGQPPGLRQADGLCEQTCIERSRQSSMPSKVAFKRVLDAASGLDGLFATAAIVNLIWNRFVTDEHGGSRATKNLSAVAPSHHQLAEQS